MESGLVAVIFGSYLGLLFSSHQYPGVLRGEVLDDNLLKPVLRLCVAIVMCLPAVGIAFLEGHDSNLYLQLLTKTLLPTFLGGFTIFGLVDIVNIKLGLLQLSTLEEGLVKGRFAQSEQQPYALDEEEMEFD